MSKPDFWGFWWRTLARQYLFHKRPIPDRVQVHAEVAGEREQALRTRQALVKAKHSADWPRDRFSPGRAW